MSTTENVEHETAEVSVHTSPAEAAAPAPQNSPARPGAPQKGEGQESPELATDAEQAVGAISISSALNSQAAIPENPAPVPALASVADERKELAVSSAVLGHLPVQTQLSELEQATYIGCEKTISDGWTSFVEVGRALACIRDGQLYRGEYDSFEDYYRKRWEYGRHYVNRLISAAQVVTRLVTNGLAT